jgi:hypothetical protein
VSNRIEIRGITKLKDCLLKSGYLVPKINENDREPSWDGFIELYKNSDEHGRKSDLLARIPVQVKSHVNVDLSYNQISHNIKKADLVNYLNDGGVIFIVVVMKNYDEHKIFFETLTPLKLKRYIKMMKKKKSQTIILKEFPKENISEFTDIFFNFSHDMKKLVSVKYLSLNDFLEKHPVGFDSFSIPYQGIQYKNPLVYFLDHEAVLYANHSTAGVSIPVEIIKLATFDQKIELPVLIGNKEYYPYFKFSLSKDGINVIIGTGISFMYYREEEKADFSFKIQGNLSQRIHDTEFILALFKHKYFSVGGANPYNFLSSSYWESFDFDANINYYNEYLNYLLSIKKVLDILKVNDDLHLDKLSENDDKNIDFILSSFLYNHCHDLEFKKPIQEDTFRQNIKICNITIALLFKKGNNGKFSVSNFFNNKLKVSFQSKKDSKFYNASLYLSLTKEDLLILSNIDYEIIYKSFFGLEPKDELLDATNRFVLNMIEVYDASKNKCLLETGTKILDWVAENDHITNPAVYVLNKLQIVKRLRKFSDIEISQIVAVIENNKDNGILVGAYLLLGNIDTASFHFNQMSKNEQNSFRKYPINKFWTHEEQKNLNNGVTL